MIPTSESPILVVGAGPTGLVAALELARLGHPVRIIEKHLHRTPLSKALAINPRTLELLEPSGTTARLLAAGWPAREIEIHGPTTTTRIRINRLQHCFNFMLVLAQHRTEAILEQRLLEEGVEVERDRALTKVQIAETGVSATVRATSGSEEVLRAPLLFAADGAQSTVRHALGIEFPGEALKPDWRLADIELEAPLDPERVHLFFGANGPLFVLRVEDQLWRLISPRYDPLEIIPESWNPKSVVWSSEFTVSHRLIETFRRGPVFFAGDAAHVHSPFGARGMNLGIEDAASFAALLHAGRMDDYAPQRSKKDAGVVRTIGRISRLAASSHPFVGWAQRRVIPWVLKLAPVQHAMLARLTGFDD